MSYHSKERRGVPIAPTRAVTATRPTATASFSGRKKKKKKVNNGEVVGRKTPEVITTSKNSSEEISVETRATKQKAAAEKEKLMNEAASVTVTETDTWNYMIDEMWLMEFA